MPEFATSAPPAAVIFDMDGLLLDSESLLRDCYRRVAAAQGWTVADGVYESLVGLPSAPSQEILRNHVPANVGIAAFGEAVRIAYAAAIEAGIPLKPHAIELASRLKTLGVPRAVATSTVSGLARLKLERGGLLPLMDVLVCGDEVVNGKPAPDIFLLAARRLRTAPADCLVFEDSPAGVRAALAAGMRVIQVPDLVSPDPGIEHRGVVIAESLLAGAVRAGLWSTP